MKNIILVIVALVILGGGGGGAYFYFIASPAEASYVTDESEEKAAKKEGEKIEYQYVELAPLILPIIDEYGVSQTVSLVVSLEVTDPYNVDKIKKMTPRLKDAYIQDMYGALNKHAALKNGVVQVSKLKKRLSKISDKVMGEGVVNDVLLQVVNQRPI